MSLSRRRKLWAFAAGLGLAAAALPAHAQTYPPASPCPPAPLLGTPMPLPSSPGAAPSPLMAPAPSAAPTPAAPPSVMPTMPTATTAPEAPSLAGSGIARGGEFEAPVNNYIDGAIPMTQFRLRFDSAYDNNRPDRAEFFYPKCGCTRGLGGSNNPIVRAQADPRARGPRNPNGESRVDYQEILSYFEYAASDRLSGFVEVPVRFINPTNNDNAAGLGDINLGVKYALLAECDSYLTFQFRTFLPTGEGDRGLGTEHVSLEPALLWWAKWSERVQVFAELRDWIAIEGSNFAGNVLRYGVGVGYRAYEGQNFWVTPVAEVVGWTVLDGKQLELESAPFLTQNASGDTIINAKIGVRVGGAHSDFAVSYGRALTGEVWYKDIVRVEYRLRF